MIQAFNGIRQAEIGIQQFGVPADPQWLSFR
jgi:hypothetical protein